MNDTQDKSAIITGAGSGVGKATAILLAESGYRLALVARTQEDLEATQKQCRDSERHLVIPADMGDPEQVKRVVETTLQNFGRIDAIANVAGAAPNMPIGQITTDDWMTCIHVNLTSVVMMTHEAWATFQKQKSGVIVNVSSLASIDPFPGFAMYASAKVAVNMFTRCTADEGKAFGLKAVTVAPGAIETPMLRSVFDEKMVPPDKAMAPETVANLICDCITGQRAFDPGEVIRIQA